MLKTRICSLFGVRHPVVLGGMGGGTNPLLVAAVCNAGGLGVQGLSGFRASALLSAMQRGLTAMRRP